MARTYTHYTKPKKHYGLKQSWIDQRNGMATREPKTLSKPSKVKAQPHPVGCDCIHHDPAFYRAPKSLRGERTSWQTKKAITIKRERTTS